MTHERKVPGDWYAGVVPTNVAIDESAYLETSFSFLFYRSTLAIQINSRIKRSERLTNASSLYLASMLDVGPRGRVSIGECVLVNGARMVCDAAIEIGDYSLVSWNVVLMDTYRFPFDRDERRRSLERVARAEPRVLDSGAPARPVRIGRNVWIGFDACILPGVSIGEGAVVGARSVVACDVEAYTVVAGNPARVIRRLPKEEVCHAP